MAPKAPKTKTPAAAPASGAKATPKAKPAPKAKPTDPKSKALAAKKAALKGTKVAPKRKIRTSTRFRRPRTLRLPRNPRYQRKALKTRPSLDQYTVIRQPLNTESAMRKMEDQNTLVFLCDVRANKQQIKEAVKKLYDVDAAKINTLIRPDGVKKAYVRLAADVEALDMANKIGFI